MTCIRRDAGYFIEGEHLDECADPTCKSCWPCVPRSDTGDPLEHCAGRNHCTEHVEAGVLTCPTCRGKTRMRLRRIGELTPLLPAAAVEAGRLDSEAVNLAGPSDPVGWSRHKVEAIHDGTFETLDEDDPAHPYAVLGRWEMMIREDYGPPTDLRITVDRAIGYLDRQLDRMAQDPEQDFPLFSHEVKTCLARIRTVLAVADYREEGAPCPACRDAGEEKPRRLRLERNDEDTSGASDRWLCPEDRSHRWSDAEYRLRVGTEYVNHSDKLTASQLHEHYRIKPGTLRVWALRDQVRQRGRDEQGRLLYDVTQALEMRDKSA